MKLREFDSRFRGCQCAETRNLLYSPSQRRTFPIIHDFLSFCDFNYRKFIFMDPPLGVNGAGSVIMGGMGTFLLTPLAGPSDANRKIGEIFILQEFYSWNVHRTEIHSNS